MQTRSTLRSPAATAVMVLLAVGCSGNGGPSEPEPSTPASLAIVAGDGQQAAAGAAVPVAPSVVVRDADGGPVAGVEVTFAVAAGGGTLQGATPTTNASGIAAVSSWVLGPSGAQRITARVGSLAAIEFEATISPGTEQFVGTIGAGGGTIELDVAGSAYEGLKLTAPAGMYAGNTQWRMSTGTLSPKFNAPAGFTVMGPPLVVQTAAARGQKLMTLEVPVNADADDLVFIALHDPASGASELLTTVERKAGSVVVATGHLRGDLLLGATPIGTIRTDLRNDATSQVIRVTLDKLDGIQTVINRWPVIDHGTGAHPEGVAAGISAINSLASSGGAPNLGNAIKGLSTAGFYAEAGALAVANQAQKVMSPEITRAFANLQPMFAQLAKHQRDRLVAENTLAMIRFMSRPAILGFMYESLGKPGAVTVASGSASHLSVVHPAKPDPTTVPVNAGGFGSFTLPLIANSAHHPVDQMLPITSTIAELDAIRGLLGDISRLSQATSDALRAQVNRELAAAAGLPTMELEFRSRADQEWTRIAANETAVVARKASAEMRLVNYFATYYRVGDAGPLERQAGESVTIVEDLGGGTASPGAKLLTPISANVSSDLVLRQANVATFEVAYAPFEVTPEEVTLTADDMTAEFDASVLLPPAGYRIAWNWGDGESSEVVGQTSASHTYEDLATYTVIARLLDAESRELAVDTVRVGQEASAWIGEVTSTQVSTEPGHLRTIHMSATGLRFVPDMDLGPNTVYRLEAGSLSLYNSVPCANYTSPTVQVDLSTQGGSAYQWLEITSEDPEAPQGSQPDHGLWFRGNAFANGFELLNKVCISGQTPNPTEYVFATGATWLRTFQSGAQQTWRKASDPNVIEGMFIRQDGNVTHTWTWRFDRVTGP